MSGLILDAALAILLVATIAYCGLLYRRLNSLRDSNAEMAQALGAFTDASARAQAEFATLKITGEKVSVALQERTASARVLCEELEIASEAGGRLVDRLEAGLAHARSAPPKSARRPANDSPPEAPADQEDGPSEAERELEAVLNRTR